MMRKLIATVVIVALVLTLAPALVFAGEGSATGQGKGGNTAPTVNAVSIVEAGTDTAVTAMTPLTTYRVKATVGDVNTVNDIQTMEFHVYYVTDGTQWDADQVAIFTWTKTGSVWAMGNGAATTTWTLETPSSSIPGDMTATVGDWYLGFKPGKLATADTVQNWKAYVKASDENKNGTLVSAAGASMGAYNEISLDTATIVFGDASAGIEPGATGYITSPVATYYTSRVTTNKQYALGLRAGSPWSDGGTNTITLSGTTGVPGGSGQFSLEVDDQQLGSPGQPKTPQAVTTTNTTITGLGAVSRVTVAQNASEGTSNNPLYMAMSLSVAGVKEVTYSGTITLTVTN